MGLFLSLVRDQCAMPVARNLKPPTTVLCPVLSTEFPLPKLDSFGFPYSETGVRSERISSGGRGSILLISATFFFHTLENSRVCGGADWVRQRWRNIVCLCTYSVQDRAQDIITNCVHIRLTALLHSTPE